MCGGFEGEQEDLSRSTRNRHSVEDMVWSASHVWVSLHTAERWECVSGLKPKRWLMSILRVGEVLGFGDVKSRVTTLVPNGTHVQ